MGRAVLLPALIALMWPATASADSKLDATDADKVKNKGQFGVQAKVGTGYRGVFRYNEEYCGDAGEDLCLGRSPFRVDIGVSYRVIERLDVLFEVRLGLEKDFGANPTTSGNRIRAYAPGVRVYFKEGGTAKFFSTLQLLADTTQFDQADKTDWGVKATMGLQVDPHRTAGLILFFGPLVSWSRWLRFEMEAGVGIQARFP